MLVLRRHGKYTTYLPIAVQQHHHSLSNSRELGQPQVEEIIMAHLSMTIGLPHVANKPLIIS